MDVVVVRAASVTRPGSPDGGSSCQARVASLRPADVDRALYADRTLVKQLAMRRTLFVFPRDLLPAAWPSASARVAATERARMVKDAVTAGLATDGDDWLDRARTAVLDVLADAPAGHQATDIRRPPVPQRLRHPLDGRVVLEHATGPRQAITAVHPSIVAPGAI